MHVRLFLFRDRGTAWAVPVTVPGKGVRKIQWKNFYFF
jgi:hypothetical protein